MTALVVALAVVVGLLTVLVVGLLRAHAEVLKALHELGLNDVLDPEASGMSIRTRPGVPTPRPAGSRTGHDIIGSTIDGGSVRAAVLDVDHLTLVAFLSSGCLTCATFWEAFADPDRRRLPGVDTRLVIVTKGPEAESPARLEPLVPSGVTTVQSSAAWDDYDVPVSPYFLLVDGSDGRIVGEGAAASWDQVKDLMGQAMADSDLTGGGQQRNHRIDDELARAGLEPGDPRLYLPTTDAEAGESS